MSQQLRATGESLTLDAAITQVRLLMTIDDHEQTAAVSEKPSEIDLERLGEQMALLTKQVAVFGIVFPGLPLTLSFSTIHF